MRPWIVQAVFLLVLIPAGRGHAHIGDEIYPFYELLDEDLDRIDLTDGSVEDWYEVVGEPSLTAVDFVWGTQSEPAEYDPSNLDFRIWLAWHQGSGTIWAAMERVDDLYVNRFEGVDDLYVNVLGGDAMNLEFWDSVIILVLDGDHSGGRYRYVNWAWCRDCPREELLENQRQAQTWLAIGEAPDGEHLHFLGVANEWVAREPYAAAGGGALGEGPAISVTELRVTPFDDLIYDDEEASVASELYPGKVIGFEISMWDNDDPQPPYEGGIRLSLTEQPSFRYADFFVDGLLLGAGEDPSVYDGDEGSAVEPSSWARIKAALQ